MAQTGPLTHGATRKRQHEGSKQLELKTTPGKRKETRTSLFHTREAKPQCETATSIRSTASRAPRHSPDHHLREHAGRKNKADHPSHGDTQSPPARPRKLGNERRDKLANAAARRTAKRMTLRTATPKQTVTQTVQPATTTTHLYRGRESNDNQNNTKQPWGETPPKAPRAILGEPHQNTAQPNDTLRTIGATQRWLETNTKHSWEEPPPEKPHKMVLGEPPPEPPRHRSGKNPPERTNQTNSTPQTLRWHGNNRNERGTVLRETLTRTTANGSGKRPPEHRATKRCTSA
ncbi:hypothetical protein Taro_000920 [Colocasia esculenta]|uniref:Uncharacterized protein n=1 Tax=Colocasia esculenta TaxID=4460 RepID=A0A843TGN1_COLES|nr:hypothetical protein [Colocasia esculenta]